MKISHNSYFKLISTVIIISKMLMKFDKLGTVELAQTAATKGSTSNSKIQQSYPKCDKMMSLIKSNIPLKT